MVSDFRKKKYLHVFKNFFDHDKSGSVNKDDFTLVVTSLAKARGDNLGQVSDVEKEMLSKIWNGLLAQADTDGDGVVKADEFVNCWDNYSKNPSAAPEWQQLYSKGMFDLLDIAKDGVIDAEEFAKINGVFGLDKAKSIEAFKKLSKGKANVNRDEFQTLFKEYFTSENPEDAGNYLFGI